MKRITTFLLFIIVPVMMLAQQPVNYNDVAVIVNYNSEISLEIGEYFRQERNIPSQNIIYISSTTAEEIDYSEFEDIRLQIEDYLIMNGLQDSINYIVTTKGVPLKVYQNSSDDDCYDECAAFDSELTLILGDSSNEIANESGFPNPYFNAEDHFTRASYGMYLVTRLDAYKVEDVLAMIDRSGPNTPVNQISANSIFDIANVDENDETAFDIFINSMQGPIDSLSQNGWTTTSHPDPSLLTNQEQVFAYRTISMGSLDGTLSNTWVEGSISELTYGYSASTFDSNVNSNNDILIADLILEGATGAHGYAYETYFGPSLRTNILFSSYIDTVGQYNLAESYFKSMLYTSWHNVVIGDPKTSIVIDNTLSVDKMDYSNNINVFPNPSSGRINIAADNLQINSLKVYNTVGQVIYSKKENSSAQNIALDFSQQGNGIFFIQMNTDKGLISKKILISK